MKAVRRGRLYDLAGPCRDDPPAFLARADLSQFWSGIRHLREI